MSVYIYILISEEVFKNLGSVFDVVVVQVWRFITSHYITLLYITCYLGFPLSLSLKRETEEKREEGRRLDMRTRRGVCYPEVVSRMCSDVRLANKNKDLHMQMRMHVAADSFIYSRKRQKKTPEKTVSDYDFFESLPDDLVISIFCKLSSTATKPSDFLNVLMTWVISQPFFSSCICLNGVWF